MERPCKHPNALGRARAKRPMAEGDNQIANGSCERACEQQWTGR